MLRKSMAVVALAVLVQVGCGAEAGPPPAADAATAPDGDPTAPLGAFVVSLGAPMIDQAGNQSSAAYTSVFGKVYDGPLPEAVAWTVVEEDQGCQLLTPRVPFCNPGCGGAAVCVDDGRCAPYPSAQNLGRVHVKGLGDAEFDMDPIAGNYQPAVGLSLPYPPCAEGGLVQMTAPGGALGALSIASRGIAPLVFEQTPAPVAGQPLVLAWTPPGRADQTRIEIKLDISHHGGTKGKIECDVPDTGSLEIPASQVSRLLALGVAGFPTIILTRVAAGTATTPSGVIALRIVSAAERAVQIEGLRSCTADSQCPAGKTCQSDLTCK
jgi:hypothetical protein